MFIDFPKLCKRLPEGQPPSVGIELQKYHPVN